MNERLSIPTLLEIMYLTNYNLSQIHEAIARNLSDEEALNLVVNRLASNPYDWGIKDLNQHINKSRSLALECLDKMEYYGVYPLAYHNEQYPITLRQIPDYPPLLFVKGRIIDSQMCAIVGSRNHSKIGEKITESVVDWSVQHGFGIVSGLALGVDEIAHRRALELNRYTLAVMPQSLDSIYPSSNYGLANQIVESGGALVSELPFGINRGKKSFVQRNRIQAALSSFIVPTQMGVNSGTMHTVNFSRKYGRPVLVLRPTQNLMSMEQYQGVIKLMSQRVPGVHVFEDEKSFFRLIEQFVLNSPQKNLFS